MTIILRVDNRWRVRSSELPLAAAEAIRSKFTHENPHRNTLRARKIPGWWAEPKEIVTWKETRDGWLTVPRGGFERVREVLGEHGLSYEVDDQRVCGKTVAIPPHRLTLFGHQETSLQAILAQETCIIRSGTGSGKSTTILAALPRVQVPSLVVVHSRALFDQWVSRVQSELGLEEKDIGTIVEGKMHLRAVTIALQKSLLKFVWNAEVRNYFGAVFADECHLFSAKTFVDTIDPLPAKIRVGVSADERRKDRKEFLAHDLFGEVASEVPHEELVASGHVMDVEVRMWPTPFEAPWYGQNEKYDFIALIQAMAADEDRNAQVIACVEQSLKEGDQVLVMAHERDHCEKLNQWLIARGASSGLLLGGPESASEFKRTLAGLRAGTMRVGVGTYKAIGTGIDVPSVGAAVAVTPIAANEQNFKQVRGRVCRVAKGKTSAKMWVLWDRFVYKGHLANVARWNPNTVVYDGENLVPARQYRKAGGA